MGSSGGNVVEQVINILRREEIQSGPVQGNGKMQSRLACGMPRPRMVEA